MIVGRIKTSDEKKVEPGRAGELGLPELGGARPLAELGLGLAELRGPSRFVCSRLFTSSVCRFLCFLLV